MVSLIDQDMRRRWKRSHEGFDVLPPGERAGRIVWVADVDQPCRSIDAREHLIQIVRVILAQLNRDDFRPRLLRKACDQIKRGPREDELLALSRESVSGHSHDFTRAAPEDHLLGRDAVESGDLDTQRFRFGVWI